jgi:FkbM family methyltransferase
MSPGAWQRLTADAAERARRRLSPATRRHARRIASWAYVRQRRLRGWLGEGAVVPGEAWSDLDAATTSALSCLIASNEHGDYCVPRLSQHRPVAQAILHSRVWEADTLDLISHADPGGDIVHAGTFFGDFLPALASTRQDGALVWAFEPSDENYRCAQITIRLNGLKSVKLTHAALGDGQGKALLQTTNREGIPLGGASRLLTDPIGGGGRAQEEVQVLALDSVIPHDRRVGVLQLDVEGHEQQALIGARQTIERCRPLIVVETPPEPSWIAAALSPLGYEHGGSVDGNFVLRCGL